MQTVSERRDIHRTDGETYFTTVIPTYANWAGCPRTRKSSSGVLLQFVGSPIHLISNTESVIAQSSAKSQLYDIGSGVSEGLHVHPFLLEAGLANNATLEFIHIIPVLNTLQNKYGTCKKDQAHEIAVPLYAKFGSECNS